MMMTERCPLSDISNAAGPSTLPCHRSPHKDTQRSESPQKELVVDTCSFDSEQGILTASESEWYSDEDDDDNGHADDSTATISPTKRGSSSKVLPPSSPAPIFFGTPSKTEHDCRLKYKTQMRTRRLLRKDSIELTRRKSGGWESHNRHDRTVVKPNGDDTIDGKGRQDEGNDLKSDGAANELRPESDPLSPTLASSAVSNETKDPADSMRDTNETEQMNTRISQQVNPIVDDGVDSAEVDVAREVSSSDIDPDETEEADWFGMKASIQANLSSQSAPSLPSTPTRGEYGQDTLLFRRAASIAPSDADSSPGVALAIHPLANRPSPLNFGMGTHIASPYTASPTFPRSTQLSPQIDQENIVHEWRRSASSHQAESSGGGGILQESPRKGNGVSQTVLSPTKSNVRQSLAAWAHARVKTPQSPEKREWDQLRASMALSPSLGREDVGESEQLLLLATKMELPASPCKTFSTTTTAGKNEMAATNPANRSSPDRPPGSALRSSKLPVPNTSRLPRPFKLSVVKAPVRADDEAERKSITSTMSSVNGKGQARPLKSTASAAFRKGTAPSRDFELSHSSSSISSVHSSSPRHAVVRTRPAVFSSPAKSTKPSAPIVRDARLIASRKGLSVSQHQPSGATQSQSAHLDIKAVEQASSGSDGIRNEPARIDAPMPPLPSKSGSVGGARRLVLGMGMQDRSESTRSRPALPSSARTTLESPASTAPPRRLGIREARNELGIDRNRRNQARPMRRINDLVRKVDHSAPKSTANVVSTPSSDEQRPRSDGAENDVALQRQVYNEKLEPTMGATSAQTDRLAAAEHHTITASTFSQAAAQVGSRGQTTMTLKPLPLSSSEMSKLTSYHTRCNEAGVAHLQLVLIRKQGEVRPPSPSSKFRKANGQAAKVAAAASGLLTAKQKAERAAREAHDRRARALQRSEAGGDAAGKVLGDSDDVPHDHSHHRLGAGDEEVYTSPVRRITLKKAVRWHRALFVGPYDEHRKTAVTPDRTHPHKSCLVNMSRSMALDRFGNVPEAGKPVGSPLVRRRKVLVTKIMYDDDEE